MATDNGFIDRIALNQAMRKMEEGLQNYSRNSQTTQPFLRGMRGGATDNRKDIDAECGYPKTEEITLEMYQNFYDRLPEGKKAVELLPKETWKVHPKLIEGDEKNTDTPLLKAWDEFCSSVGQSGKGYHRKQEGSRIWNYLRRLDQLAGIGHYGVLLIGLNDGKDLSEPVDGMDEVSNAFDGKTKLRKDRKVLFLQPFSEVRAEVVQCEEDTNSERFGAPTVYDLDFETGIFGGTEIKTKRVHWHRVIHFADNTDENDYIGIPRQRPCFNQLINLYLLYGCSSEMFWNGAFPTEWFTTHPQLGGDVIVDKASFRQQMERIKNSAQRWGLLNALQPMQLPPIVADPTAQIALNRKGITLILDIPDRIFEGSERGELSSAQDSDEWEGRLGGRRNDTASPCICDPVAERLIAYGILPEPDSEEGIQWKWPERDNASALEKAQKNLIKTQDAAAYVGGNVETLIERKRYLVDHQDMTEEEADKNMKATTAYEEEVAAEEEEMMAAQQEQALALAKAGGKPAPGAAGGKPSPFGQKPAGGKPKQPAPFTKNAQNVFCATGEGGGVDPSCSASGGKSAVERPAARKLRLVKAGKLKKEEAVRQMQASIASMILGRDFGEDVDAYFARRPDLTQTRAEYRAAIEELENS